MTFDRNLKQIVTRWEALPGYDTYGKRTFAAPVAVKARWEDWVEVFRNKHGDEVRSRARVFFKIPIGPDDYLYLGTSIAADPTTVTDAWEVSGVRKIPDLRNLNSIYVALL